MEHVDQNLSINLTPPPRLPCPAVSVVIPLYNAEEYIGECLDSVLKQTFQSFEVIVVDDCSTDKSREIVEEYIKKFPGKIRLSSTEKNSGGGGKPRNIGLNLAGSEYVFFVDADDFLRATALETFHEAAKEYKADVVYTGSRYGLKNSDSVYLHKDIVGKRLYSKNWEDRINLRVNNPKKNLQELLLEDGEGNFSTPWSKFIRRDFLLQNKILFPETITLGEDFIWTVNVYCHAKRFLRIPTPLYFHRQGNASSVSRTKREPLEQLSHWISEFFNFVKSFSALEQENEILSEDSTYRLATLKRHFNWCLSRTAEARESLSNQDVYEVLYREFASQKDLPDFLLPMLFATIDNEKKANKSNSQTIGKLKKSVVTLEKERNYFSRPAVSVIIPVYNAEKYIGECLDSVLAQTFQSFEVIVVDDCSTDSSYEMVESYIPKFNGRLKLCRMNENTGSGALPRNKGIMLSCGEYIQFLDADDMLTQTALEELYTLAKEYDADAVYCEKFYETDADGTNTRVGSFHEGALVDNPTLETEDLDRRFNKIISCEYSILIWDKIIKRNLIVDNEIFFPKVRISEDDIWTYALTFYAKKILIVPNVVNIRRLSENSMARTHRTPQQTVNFWTNPILLGLKSLDNLLNRHEFFKKNLSNRYDILKFFASSRFNIALNENSELAEDTIYTTIKEEFGARLGEYDVLISALCTFIYSEKNARRDDAQKLSKFYNLITARIDVKFTTTGDGDFQILSVSDKKAKIEKPGWFQENGIGYVIHSYNGELKFVARATATGKIMLSVKGSDVRTPEDFNKRIPYWIDYTSLTVNDTELLNAPIPTWHDKPYYYTMDVKADEEITVQTEWLPHRSDNTEVQMISKFRNFITARIDVKFIPEGEGDFQILSVSDKKAKIEKPDWFQENGTGYMIHSYNGELKFVAKATDDGKIQLSVRGVDVRSPEDFNKRIPYWIDYTSLTVNDNVVFNTLTSAWHDKPYYYTMDVKAGEEITVQTEWLPHRNDNSNEVKIQKVPDEAAQKVLSRLNNFITARIDFRLISEGKGDLQILSMSDEKAKISKPTWLNKGGAGYLVSSCVGKIRFVAKATVNGKIQIFLRGLDVRSPEDNSKRIPYWIDYTSLTVNDTELLSAPISTWHDKPFRYNMDVKAGEEITVQTEWFPHRSDNPETQIPIKFRNFLTARMDVVFTTSGEGNFQILSMSDEKAKISKPTWLNKGGAGYLVSSCVGKIRFVAKATVNGKIQIFLRGLDVRASEDNSKRIPYWIDYTSFIVNDNVIFDTLTPLWHDKPFRYEMDVKANEEITVQVEWLPHKEQ